MRASSARWWTVYKDFGELVFRQGAVHAGVVLLRLAGLANATKGKIVAEGTPAALRARPELRRACLGLDGDDPE